MASKHEETIEEEVANNEDEPKEETTKSEDSSTDSQKYIIIDVEEKVFYEVEKICPIPAQQLIEQEEYPVENHYVSTSDGYILNILRIPSGKDQPSNGNVVYLQHGLMGACTDWILFGKKRGLAYILADKGFDVWLGNDRGNMYSRKHKYLNPDKDGKFWDFSWHEIGNIDIPAMIDFILEKTGKKKLYHVGYSQGTTSFYVMASTRPEYNDKIIHHISLAPIAFTNYIRSPLIKLLSFNTFPVGLALRSLGLHEFLPTESLLSFLSNILCSEGMGRVICKNAMFAVCGFNTKQTNPSELPLISSYYPAGAATKQLVHYGQGYKTDRFTQYDYGCLRNLVHYWQRFPPKYDLSKITAPMTLIYSQNDWLSSPQDVERLSNIVKSVKETYLVQDPLWNHIDYLFGNEAPEIVYNKVVDVLMNN